MIFHLESQATEALWSLSGRRTAISWIRMMIFLKYSWSPDTPLHGLHMWLDKLICAEAALEDFPNLGYSHSFLPRSGTTVLPSPYYALNLVYIISTTANVQCDATSQIVCWPNPERGNVMAIEIQRSTFVTHVSLRDSYSRWILYNIYCDFEQ